ncbi:unnamed protein product [Closterium sp. NIES-54]
MLLAPEGDPDAPDIPTPRFYAEAITGPYSSQWQAAMDAKMASWNSTGTFVDAVPPSRANIVDGMWIFTVERPQGSPPAFKARFVARGFSQRQGVDYFQTFSPTPKMTTLWVLLHVAAQRDYELHSLDFSTAFLKGNLHEEIWLRHPPGFTGSFLAGTQWSLRWPVYGLRQTPHEWHDTLRTTLAALGFAPSTPDPLLFLRTDTSLPPFYVLVYVDNLVFATADTEALTLVKSELQNKHTCTDLGELRSYLGLQITWDRARRTITLTQSHMMHQVLQRFGFQFSSPQPTPLYTGHSLSTPPSDESVEPSGPYPELVGCLVHRCTVPPAPVPLDAALPAPRPPAQGSTSPAPSVLGSPVPAPPAPATLAPRSPAPAPLAPAPPAPPAPAAPIPQAPGSTALVPPAPGSPAPAPPAPPVPEALVPLVRAPPGLAAPAPPGPPSPAETPAPPRLVAPAPLALVTPTAESPTPLAPLQRRDLQKKQYP